jgi:hypothetical protein
MLAAVEQMPADWDETELAWYLVHRAELFTPTARSPAAQGTRGRGHDPATVTNVTLAFAEATLSGL